MTKPPFTFDSKKWAPHSSHCTFKAHSHGFDCHSNCPTCGGSPMKLEIQMSETPSNPGPSDIPGMSSEELRAAAESVLRQQPPEVQAAVEKSKSFYTQNRPLILTGVALFAVMKINKRMVKKATVKAVAKALANSPAVAPNGTSYPTMFDILEDLRATPGMAYIPHSGGMVHLLKGKDAIVTVFGEFENMETKEIWDHVAKILNLNVRV